MANNRIARRGLQKSPNFLILFGRRAFISKLNQTKQKYEKGFPQMLGPEAAGFEPATFRLTVDCSTAKLRLQIPTYLRTKNKRFKDKNLFKIKRD